MTPGGTATADPTKQDTTPDAIGDKIDRFKEQAGAAVGDMPARIPPDADGESTKQDVSVEGTTTIGETSHGPKPPTYGTVRFEGLKELKLPLGEGFERGDIVEFSGTGVIIEVAERNEEDTHQNLVDVKQKHLLKARKVHIRPVGKTHEQPRLGEEPIEGDEPSED